ncbi:hypothetical protein G6W57_08550 [Streptomyces sp. CAI-121]|uniref:hypothetical protein n=1 Tax=unclassified Streptomyces TaxID=2593676 RepID=UPI001587C093|nr:MULTISPECIES: hypothetical protein [unclassified Streptomyces]NUV67158.1 hypothetical protein [Streptomyces sp. CAI-121]NUW13276.1 hypothetical protein [Streptomyces sp. CAI-68]
MGDGAALVDRIAERRAGVGDPGALVGELRRALVLVPYDRGGLWTAEFGGIRWVCGFTDEAALARFAEERALVEGAEVGAASRSWEYAVFRGARLLDEVIPAMGVPAGVAVNVADPDGAMLFPPVVGIVPDGVAVDADADADADADVLGGGRGL